MLIALLLLGFAGWYHGRCMYETGREMGRLEAKGEALTAQAERQRPVLRVVR